MLPKVSKNAAERMAFDIQFAANWIHVRNVPSIIFRFWVWGYDAKGLSNKYVLFRPFNTLAGVWVLKISGVEIRLEDGCHFHVEGTLRNAKKAF